MSGSNQPKDLFEFLTEAELQHYYNVLSNQLKVTTVPQLKYVEDEDLQELGMTKPEIRRLKKFFKKECPQGTFSKIRKILSTGKEASVPAVSVSSPPRSASKQVIPDDAITVHKTLGSGEFGTVAQGVWTNEHGDRVQVAIKSVTKQRMQNTSADFLKEAAIMQTVDHEHIVRLYGVTIAEDELRLVSELAPLRSLLECLKEPSLRGSFPVTQLCDFSFQIASGMAHLEAKRLIHRDLAARNILVFAKDKVKVSDFGLSRALGVGKDYYQTNFNVNLKLPIAWCAPESINFLKFTSASDVWAYGVTLWEMFSYGFQPWAALTGEQDDDISSLRDIANTHSSSWKFAQKILEAIDEPNCQRLEQPECCPKEHYAIMKKCWEHDADRRPHFAELQLMLPQLRPERVQTTCDAPVSSYKDALQYRNSDVIIVLDKRPEHPPEEGMWKGVTEPGGKVGYFHSANAKPCTDSKPSTAVSPAQRRQKVARKESGRKSSRQSRRLDATMIGVPEKDLRHMGHIGYDGAVFGDVSFIGNSYDKLPVKVASPAKHNGSASMSASMTCASQSEDSKPTEMNHSQSELSFPMHSKTSSSMSGLSNSSQDDTLTDVSSMQGSQMSIPMMHQDTSSLLPSGGGGGGDAEADDFFKMPDLSSGFDLDFGSSLMDDIMKSLSEMSHHDDPDGGDTTLLDDRSPLIDTTLSFSSSSSQPPLAPFPNGDDGGGGRSSFDNLGMEDSDSLGWGGREDQDSQRSAGSQEEEEGEERGSSPGYSDDASSRKKQRPKLRIEHVDDDDDDDDMYEVSQTIPSRKDLDSGVGVKPMSASDEKKIDEAIELANEFATLSTSEQMSPRSPADSLDMEGSGSSPRLRAMFGLNKKRGGSAEKSPKAEKKSFSEEMANVSDVGEELTPEAQEAYNMLVVRGSKETKPTPRERPPRVHRRSLEEDPDTGRRSMRTNNNANIRAPQGIPGRKVAAAETTETDSNPLRRLRESSFIAPKPKPKPRPDVNGRPNLHANLPFFDKLKEQEAQSEEGEEDSSSAGRPQPPPRNPMRSSTVNTKPRERKNPLDLSTYRAKTTSEIISPRTHKDLNTSRDSEDSAFNTESDASSSASGGGGRSQRPKSNDSFVGYFAVKPSQQQQQSSSQFPVKAIKLSASELGLGNSDDRFWRSEMDMAGGDADMMDAGPAMLGRYRTSDTVSYEDLLEFALDNGATQQNEAAEEEEEEEECFMKGVERGEPANVSDQVRLMTKLLSAQVSHEDCMYALEETSWDVHAAIKLLKLKQLLSTRRGDQDTCKNALIAHAWDVERAARFLADEDDNDADLDDDKRGRDSPELVHV